MCRFCRRPAGSLLCAWIALRTPLVITTRGLNFHLCVFIVFVKGLYFIVFVLVILLEAYSMILSFVEVSSFLFVNLSLLQNS